MVDKKGMDVPDDWEVHEEELPKEKKKRDFQVSNNVLWLIFISVLLIFIALPLIAKSPPKELQTTYVNGIPILAEGEPIVELKRLVNKHIEGQRLDESEDAHNALSEIFVVMGQGKAGITGKSYTLYAGLGSNTEIKIQDNTVRIEGKDRRDFWTAVWTFNSLISNTEIDSNVDLFDVQDILQGMENVYLVQDQENACVQYGYIISAEGDIMSPLGFKQAEHGFDLHHYQKSGDNCTEFVNGTETRVECPTAGGTDFVITMHRGLANKFTIDENTIDFEYVTCESVSSISVILRDILYPNIISVLSGFSLPTEITF